jgi:hypothetical protein
VTASPLITGAPRGVCARLRRGATDLFGRGRQAFRALIERAVYPGSFRRRHVEWHTELSALGGIEDPASGEYRWHVPATRITRPRRGESPSRRPPLSGRAPSPVSKRAARSHPSDGRAGRAVRDTHGPLSDDHASASRPTERPHRVAYHRAGGGAAAWHRRERNPSGACGGR